MRVAAAVIFVIAGGFLYRMWFHGHDSSSQLASHYQQQQIEPAGNKAILTMSDGNSINLDSLRDGTVITKGAAKISKRGGLLVYDMATQQPATRVVENTLSTPRGGQYQVVLADGTKVWLNAASSLHFPSHFSGTQRVVSLTGEAYFEVAKNKHQPFVVQAGQMQVHVLGTHFNVNAYAEESSIKTSLLEGSVKITSGATTSFLHPGEQAILNHDENKVRIGRVNMDEVIAWKNGVFQFDDADINAVMREIGRWYNVEIVYSGKVPDRRFEGKISRSAALAEVLKILELTGVKFQVVGNKIEVQ
jgi:ferric-dicitrate binding protein FerR (iron transport regulator)